MATKFTYETITFPPNHVHCDWWVGIKSVDGIEDSRIIRWLQIQVGKGETEQKAVFDLIDKMSLIVGRQTVEAAIHS